MTCGGVKYEAVAGVGADDCATSAIADPATNPSVSAARRIDMYSSEARILLRYCSSRASVMWVHSSSRDPANMSREARRYQ